MKKFTYTDPITNLIVFETIEANWISKFGTDGKLRGVGIDPKPLHCKIENLDKFEPSVGRFDKNKRTDGFI